MCKMLSVVRIHYRPGTTLSTDLYLILRTTYGKGAVISPILQIETLRHRDVQGLDQRCILGSHTLGV